MSDKTCEESSCGCKRSYCAIETPFVTSKVLRFVARRRPSRLVSWIVGILLMSMLTVIAMVSRMCCDQMFSGECFPMLALACTYALVIVSIVCALIRCFEAYLGFRNRMFSSLKELELKRMELEQEIVKESIAASKAFVSKKECTNEDKGMKLDYCVTIRKEFPVAVKK